MQGQICLVTGSTSGIGFVTARELARSGATVVLVCRSRSKGEAARTQIQQATGNANLDVLVADLSSQTAIRQLAADFKLKYEHLHVLVNNAGSSFSQRTLAPDGLEMTFAVDHLAYFLLTNLLLDTLKASAPARIINVSSQAQSIGQIHFDDLQLATKYTEFRAYSQAKLANVLFTKELARRLEGTAVTVNCLHPGAVKSNFAHDSIGLFGFLLKISRPIQISPERGAETSIYLATSPDVEAISGQYFIKKHLATSSKISRDPAVAARLWEVSRQLTHLSEAE